MIRGMITREQALRNHPELGVLLTIERRQDWIFRHAVDPHGREAMTASRTTPIHTDAVHILGPNDYAACRIHADHYYGGGCVWQRYGRDLEELIRDLLALPEPDEPGAPRLVRPINQLWIPL